jgi:glycosyltransferase 2 family protein
MTPLRRKVISTIFVVAIIAFLGAYLARVDYSKLEMLTFDWQMLVLATIVALSFRFWGVYIWQVILYELGSAPLPDFRILSSVYSKAWMGRYIPGKVAWITGKIYMAGSLGISKSRLAVSSLLEGGMQILALLATSMLLLGFDPRLEVFKGEPRLLLVGFACVCLFALTPKVFNALVRRAYLIVRKHEPGPDLRINQRIAFKAFWLYSIGAIFSGTSFFFLAKAVDPAVSHSLYIFFVGSYNLAGALGMATPILPSGIGVRDGVLLVLLALVLPPEVAVALAVLGRLWSAAVDVLFYIVSAAALRYSNGISR